MEKSETIVADPTCRKGDHLYVSSGDNVLTSASWGRAGGLASHRAATSRNHCSVVRSTTRTRFKWNSWCAEPLSVGRKQYLRASSDACTRRAPRRMDGGTMVGGTGMQSREVSYSISVATGMRNANSSRVWEYGTAHEVVVAVSSVIISRRSEGPLGFRGHGTYEGLGYCPNGLQDLSAKPSHIGYDEAQCKPEEMKGRQ